MFLRRLIPLLALLLLPAAAARADAPAAAGARPTAGEVLGQVDTRYKTMKSGWFLGRIVSHVTGAMTQELDAPVTAALRRPGRLRSEMHDEKNGSMHLISDSTSWLYVSSLRQYVITTGAPPPPEDALPDLLKEFSGLAARLTDAALVREEPVTVNGAPSDCYVIESHARPAFGQAKVDSFSSTYWIDKQRLVVVRDSTYLEVTPPGAPSKLNVNSIFIFELVKLDEPIPDSLFVFKVPAGAQKVDRIGAPQQQAPRADFTGKEGFDFKLTSLEGKPVSLKSLRGKVVMLDFWATWCGPCRREMPVIQKLSKELKAKGLLVYGVNNEADHDKVKSFLAENKYTFPTLMDQEGAVSKQYQVNAIPTLLIVGRDGKIVAHYIGGQEEDVLRGALKRAGVQ